MSVYDGFRRKKSPDLLRIKALYWWAVKDLNLRPAD
jgi:hypothetical protein